MINRYFGGRIKREIVAELNVTHPNKSSVNSKKF